MKARIEENVRKVNTMIHVISREHEHSLMADKYDIKESDDEEESDEEDGDEGGEREEKDGFTTTDTDESRPQTPLGVQSSVAASTVLTTGGYLGDVAEGWDRKEEHRTRYRLYKSSSLVSPEAAMRTRPLDRAAIQRLLDKVDSGVAQEAEEVHARLRGLPHASPSLTLSPTPLPPLGARLRGADALPPRRETPRDGQFHVAKHARHARGETRRMHQVRVCLCPRGVAWRA